MNKKIWGAFAGICALLMFTLGVVPVLAQQTAVKEKAPMYSYVANWAIPRAQWAELEKSNGATDSMMQKALAGGTIVAYGNDENLIHGGDGSTHDNWWSAMSIAGLINVLDQLRGPSNNAVLSSATKHWDNIYVSRYYNWHPGAIKNGYTSGSVYKLKAGAPDDAVETLSKNLVAPLLEKMLSDGTISEYEIDTEAYHTDSPGTFIIVYILQNAAGIDKVDAAIMDTLKANPLSGPAFGSMVDSSAHRDFLDRTNATYK